jgi:hypothetical protein
MVASLTVVPHLLSCGHGLVPVRANRVVTTTDGQTRPSVRPSVTSDKVLVRQIRVNAMLTSDKVKLELLCPRWLPRCCHVGWLDVSFHYIARAAEHIVL